MTDPLAQRVEALFFAASQLDPAARGPFLAARAEEDPEAAAEVRAMLDLSEEELGRVFAEPAYDATAGESAGDQLGPYKLLEELGEGGFGTVWRAEQVRPVRRTVALKILKAGMDTKQVLARFEAERNALSLMNHPSIARVLDAGATAAGRPFFVMELVEGIPITDFCDQEELSIARRLELFVDVCTAVQHAHQKGLIHRDLKPGNILVTMLDGKPVPKVIDFGIAKATGQSLSEGTLFTQQGQLMGTPEYMSPEQAEMSGIGVDSTTDIYALGVLLYELLTGVLPFDAATLRSRGLAEIHRFLREEEPPKPSTRVSTLGPDTAAIGRRRRVDPRKLRSELSGDLDWICLRAMEKQRTRRYPSASELAADVRRHLEDEPVLAGPPSASYRAQKFVRRNRAAVVFAATVLALLVGGIAATTRGMVLAERAREAADEAREDALAAEKLAALQREEAERQRGVAVAERAEAELQTARAEESLTLADSEAARARAVTDFLLDTLGLADPDVTELPDMSMAAALDEASLRVGEAFREFPESEAEVRLVLGRAYFTLGRPDLAGPHLRRALSLHRSVLHSDLGPIRDVLRVLWQVANRLWQSDWQALARKAKDLNLELLGRTHPELSDGFRRLDAMAMNPFVPEAQVRAEWEELCAEARATVGPDDPSGAYLRMAMPGAPLVMGWRSSTTDAAEMIEDLLARSAAPPTNAALRLLTENALHFRIRAGDFAGARTLLADRKARLTAMLGPDHWYLSIYRYFEASCLVAEGRADEARVLFERCLDTLYASPAPDLWEALVVEQALAELHEAAGRADLAEPYRARLLERILDGEIDFVWPVPRGVLSPAYGELFDACDAFDAAVKRCLRSDEPPGECVSEVSKLAREILEARRRVVPGDDPVALVMAPQLSERGALLLGWPELAADGEALLREAHRDGGRGTGWIATRLRTAATLRGHLVSSGRDEEAAELANDEAFLLSELPSARTWAGLAEDAQNDLIWRLVRAPGLNAQACDQALELARELAESSPSSPAIANTLGAALYRAGRFDEAIQALERSAGTASGEERPAELGFLAMAHQRRGAAQAARENLARLRNAVERDGQDSVEARALLVEAEEVVSRD